MQALNADDTFNYELLRVLGSARYAAADVGEVLDVAERIVPGDFESWTSEFKALAQKVEASLASGPAPASDVSIRDVLFRAASYWRTADFFIHGDVQDPRIVQFWTEQTRCFDAAIGRLPISAVRFEVPTADFLIRGTLYRASNDAAARPTLLLCNGFDGSEEEMAHLIGFSALDRGINVVTFEGPGHPSVRRFQGVGFIPEWERVIVPLVDHVLGFSGIDGKRLGLLGYSLGGYFAPRAAAFEHRLAALICIDGILDASFDLKRLLSPELQGLLTAGDRHAFNAAIPQAIQVSTNIRWFVDQGVWSFKVESAFDLFEKVQALSLEDVVGQIRCPTFVGDGPRDRFFAGQPRRLADALGRRATYHVFTEAMSAGLHCQVAATTELNRAALDWFIDVVR